MKPKISLPGPRPVTLLSVVGTGISRGGRSIVNGIAGGGGIPRGTYSNITELGEMGVGDFIIGKLTVIL